MIYLLVIITGPYYLLVEAKYRSGFGKATSTRKHQLVREIEGGVLEAGSLDKNFKILITTADYYFKPEILEDVPPQHKQDLIWINWQKIAFLIFGILEQEPNISPETIMFAEDLYELLLRKNLRNFEGIKVLSQAGNLSDYQETIFFQANTASYRGDFIGFIQAMEILPNIPSSKNILFFEPQRRFFQFSGFMNNMATEQNETLFFKGSKQYE